MELPLLQLWVLASAADGCPGARFHFAATKYQHLASRLSMTLDAARFLVQFAGVSY
jgi:hypothetical protein